MNRPQSIISHKPTLQTLDAVFCDSLQVLKQAEMSGLSPHARILSSSPALCLALPERAVNLEGRISESKIERFFETSFDFIQAVHSAVRAEPGLENLAIICTRQAMEIQRFIYKAGGLKSVDFTNSRGILSARTGNPITDARMNTPWASLLAANPALQEVSFPTTMTQERADGGGYAPPFRTRVRFASLEGISYRIFLAIWRYLPASLSRGEILILSEGELVKETASFLALRGYALRILSEPGRDELQKELLLSEGKRQTLRSILTPIIEKRILLLAPHEAAPPILKMFFSSLFDDLDAQCASKLAWEKRIGERVKSVLSGYPKGGNNIALSELCREKGFPFIAFQHGIDREITKAQDSNQANFENSIADVFFAYNERGKALSKKNPFAIPGKIHAIGLSKDHFRVSKNNSSCNKTPILYASTACYRGNVQRRIDGVSDLQMAEQEIALIEKVFSKLPHGIDFKPYPSLRYPDPDPVLSAVRRSPNVRLVEEGIDLRYLLERYSVLVTSRATSTIGWCVMAKRPLIFLEMPFYFASRPEARAAFEEATFFIDTQDEDWMAQLQSFLSQPIVDIQKAWEKKRAAHGRLILDFFTTMEPGAGKRGARIIETIIQTSKPCPISASI